MAENAIVAASRAGRDLSLLMIDVDRFKEINDNYGHAAGDEILMAVSNLLQENLRSSEVVGRYGGDEFLVLLESTDGHKAFRTAERLRENTEDSPVLVGGDVVRVTLSIGVAALGPGARTLEALLEQADRGLYLSKNTGRNQTCVAHV
jgi:diguanylate cyclase (GGDEF)-like protein